MLTGEIRSQIDSIWNDFWSGGVSNPLSVIEQITYLLFIKRLDELHTVEERKATQLKIEMERRIFPKGKDERGRSYKDLRWSRFKSFEPREMFTVVDEHVFPFLRTLGGEGSAFSQHMKDARLGIPTPALLAKAVEKLDDVRMDDRDTKGDVYEYMLGKIATAGQNGQFRTPRHIIALMVELTEPKPTDIICDPAAGTCGFLVAVGEYLRRRHPEVLRDPKLRKHFHETMFNGFDFDSTMLRIGSMNMMLHGVESAHVVYRDSLAEDHASEAGRYSLVLANPPFAGALDHEACAKDLQQIVKTKRPSCSSLLCFSDCSKWAVALRSLCRKVCCSAPQRRTKTCVGCWSKTINWTQLSQCRLACSGPMPVCLLQSWYSPRPASAERTMCGSTTWKPMAGR